MFKRHAALLTAILLVVGATGVFATTTDSEFATLAQFLGLEDRVDDLESRVAAVESELGLAAPDPDGSEPDDPGTPSEPAEPSEPSEPSEPTDPTEPTEPDGSDPSEDPDDGGDSHDHEEPADPDPSESESPDEPDETTDQLTLTGDYPDGFTVAAGQTALIKGHVTTPKNVVVHGTLVMRPGSHLQFRDVDMTTYVGASDTLHQPVVDSDVGLWVMGEGRLDLAGTPKQGWNRTGSHSTWQSGDEYWISPTAPGDYDPRPWKPGDPIPQADPRVPAAEVMNVTRDVVIQGPAHIHIHSQNPQRIEYVQLRSMGVSNSAHDGPVLGRYALHFHHGGDGTRGTIVRGVAAVNSRGRVFVPHESHGITLEDVVSVNSYAEVLWWDQGDVTEDLTVDRLAASGVHMPISVAGERRNIPVTTLGSNERASLRNSAVSGARGNFRAGGFDWDTDDGHLPDRKAVWDFHGNVTHNNEGNGLRFWFNEKWAHNVRHSAVYNNGEYGIETGAYSNTIRYSDMLVLGNGKGGILHHSSSNIQVDDGGPGRYQNVTVEGPGPALEVGRLRGSPLTRQEFIDCDLGGQPRVRLDANDKTDHPFIALFRNCGDLTPDDFVFGGSGISSAMNGSSIIIEHPDGRRWHIKVENGKKVVEAA